MSDINKTKNGTASTLLQKMVSIATDGEIVYCILRGR